MNESSWVYGALVLAFGAIAYLFREVSILKVSNSEFKSQLPLINQKLDELNKTLKLFLKQEIDTLKDIAKERD